MKLHHNIQYENTPKRVRERTNSLRMIVSQRAEEETKIFVPYRKSFHQENAAPKASRLSTTKKGEKESETKINAPYAPPPPTIPLPNGVPALGGGCQNELFGLLAGLRKGSRIPAIFRALPTRGRSAVPVLGVSKPVAVVMGGVPGVPGGGVSE